MAVKAVMLPKICQVIVLWAEEAVENDKAYAATSSVVGNLSPIDSE